MLFKVCTQVQLFAFIISSLFHPGLPRSFSSPSDLRRITDSLAFQLFTNQTPKDDIAIASNPSYLPANDPRVQNIENFIGNTMRCHNVPGLSIAVINKDNAIINKGFGKADLSGDRDVNEDSRFCVGSITKPFVATLLGILLEENRQRFPWKWDTKVHEIMGEDFRLVDDLRTTETTIRDLLSHRVGLATYKTAWQVGLDPHHSRQEYCSRLWLLNNIDDFRSSHDYNNFMYLLSACIAERLGGAEFEQLMRQRVLNPLRMDSSAFVSEIANLEILSKAYVYNETGKSLDELDQLLLRAVSPAESAGGLCTSADDMSRWLQFQLEHGRAHNGWPLMEQDTWADIHTSQNSLPERQLGDNRIVKPYFPVTDLEYAYGLGWVKGNYRGYEYSRHGGTVSGFESLVTVYNDLELAIYTSINGPMKAKSVNTVLHHYISDVLLGEEPYLDAQTACTFPKPWSQSSPQVLERFKDRARKSKLESQAPDSEARREMERKIRKQKNIIRHKHEKFVGNYGHLLFGNLTVSYDSEAVELRFQLGRIGTGRLQAVVPEAFWLLKLDGPLAHTEFGGIAIMFMDEQNHKFQIIKALGYEKFSPPLFQRDLKWTDVNHVSRPPENRDSFFGSFGFF